MAGVVVYRGSEPGVVTLPGEGVRSVTPGLAYEMSLENAARLIASNPRMWEAGNEETQVYVPPASPLAVPPVAAQKLSSVGARVTPLIVNANFTTDGVLTKYKVAHKLGTWNVQVTAQTHTGGKANEQTTLAKIVAISQEEIEVTLSAAGAAGVTYWLQIQGTPG